MKNKTHQAPRALSMTPLAAAALALLMGVTADIGAVGLGAAGSSATLGRPLDFAIPLRLEDGETLTAECLSADVYNGTQKVLPSDVRVRLMPGATPAERIARVTTKSAIYEPVIEVELRAGCDRRYTRRYTAFADPPAARDLVPALPTLAQVDPLTIDKPVDAPAKAASRSVHIAANTTYAIAAAEQVTKAETKDSKPPRKQRRSKGKSDATTASASNSTTASTTANASIKMAAATPEAKRSRKSRGAADDVRARPARLVLERAAPVLKMDMEEPVFVARSGQTPGAIASASAADLLAAVTAAASAAPAAPQPVPADPGQLRALERKIADLKRQSLEHQQTNAALTARLAEAESRTGFTPWLWGLIGLLGLTAAGLGWRQFRHSHYQVNEAEWWADSEAAKTESVAPQSVAELDAPDSEITGAGDDLPSRAPQINWDPEDPISEATGSNRHLPDLDSSQTGIDTGYGPVREVSAEELMDLDQQAAFLVGLGQDDAAVDLLKNHLRSTGGMSPLPYAKLMEIHYRRDARRAYDRVRTRFARRFGAEAPAWEMGPLRGRALDDYPQIVAKINAMWASPREAMGFLETVLFHADAAIELLDLSAYDDVLLLYSIARELSTLPAVEPANVDFELPLNEDPLPAIDAFPALAADVPAAATDIDPFNLPADSSKWLSAEVPAPAAPAKNDAAGVQVTLDPSRLRA